MALSQSQRARLGSHTPLALKAVQRRVEGEPDMIGRRGLVGQARVDRALELLRPVIEGQAELDDNTAELAKIVLTDAYAKMRKTTDGMVGREPMGKA